VDIIGSIDEQIANNIEIRNKLIRIINYIYLTDKSSCSQIKNYAKIYVGKEDASHADINGKYNFYTCAEYPLKCNDYEFNDSCIILAGNGNFRVSHYHGKFNAYQRTYIIIPKDKLYYGLFYIAIKKYVYNLRKASSGSIIKFIGIDDVRKCLFKKMNKQKILYIDAIIKRLDEINLIITNLKKYRNVILSLLLNEQIK